MMQNKNNFLLWLVLLLTGLALPLSAKQDSASTRLVPAQAAIATAHPLATRAGELILQKGGNAFDAAVAVTAVLAVVEPYSSGLGGGGFYLIHDVQDDRRVMLDARERAPLAAHKDMYLDEQGQVIDGLSVDGPLAAGIPGIPAALVHLAHNYGRLPLRESLAPAITLAQIGFTVDPIYRRMAGFRSQALSQSPAAAAVFLPGGKVPAEGHRIRQPDLARTLTQLALHGRAGFYEGDVAKKLVEGVRAAGGIWQAADLLDYRVVEREPIVFHYRGYTVTSAAPPSSGGVALATILNILSNFDLHKLDDGQRIHIMVEAMRRAYRDRAEYLGDPDYSAVPVQRLTSPDYAAGLSQSIRLDRATASGELAPVGSHAGSGRHTTHFSIIDRQGNRVAATLSINYPFGSGFMPPGTGILLNDEMDDFSAKPGVPNVYGLVGAQANAVASGKRPLSSMSPTFIENDQGVLVLGTPGGSRIITMVLLGLLEHIQGGEVQAVVKRPRFHHQYLPDEIQFEPGALNEAQQAALKALGHSLKALTDTYGNMQAVQWDYQTGEVSAASDPRGIGQAIKFRAKIKE